MFKKKDSQKPDFNFINEYMVLQKNERPTSYYKIKTKSLSKISIFLMFMSFIMIISGKFIIENRNSEKKDYITNVFGNNIEYIQTERRQEIVEEFVQYQQGENNE